MAILCLLLGNTAAAQDDPLWRLFRQKAAISKSMVVFPPGADIPLLHGLGPCLGRVCLLEEGGSATHTGAAALPQGAVARPPAHYRLRLDRAGELSGFVTAHTAGASGAGVYLAVIDTGLDWWHEDFIDERGQTRVAWLLDQTLPPRGRHPELEAIGGGAVFDAAELQAALAGADLFAAAAGRDFLGHGTHVAGIAVSDDVLYRGAAPRARLVAVKAMGEHGFEEDQVLRALVFVDQVARRDGVPLVVNLSFGNQLGGHDGSEPIEIALDELAARPGRAVAVAAGNDAERRLHFRTALSGWRREIRLLVPSVPQAPPAPYLLVDLWLKDAANCELSLRVPSGEEVGPVGPAGPIAILQDTDSGRAELESAVGPDPLNGDLRFVLRLSAEGGVPLEDGIWTLIFSGRASRLDGWVAEAELGGSWPRFLDMEDPSALVGPPATARNVIAVGAWVSRNRWTDAEGNPVAIEEPEGSLGYFSSPGPTRDGRPKPELSAPGMMVAATLSADADPRSPQSMFYAGGSLRLVAADGRHAFGAGTSMASPFAAGLAALVLERHPQWTGLQVRDALATGTGQDASCGYGGLYLPGWGFGKLRAERALAAAAGFSEAAADARESLCGVTLPWQAPQEIGISGNEVFALAVPRDSRGVPLGPGREVDFRSPAGFAGPLEDLGGGIYRRRLAPGARRGSQFEIRCRAEGVEFSARQTVTVAASLAEASGGGGGGCTTAGAGSSGAWLLVLAMRSLNGRSSSRCSWRRSNSSRKSRPSWG